MKSIQKTPEMNGANRYGVRFNLLDPQRQIIVLLDAFGESHKHRPKATSSQTKKFRANVLYGFLNSVRQAGYHLRNLLQVDQRHISVCIESWIQDGLAPSTLQSRLSALRWFSIALGKGGMVKSQEEYGLTPEMLQRSAVATRDKSWSATGCSAEDLLKKASETDVWVGTQLALMRSFGLRVTEAILIRPRSSHRGDALKIEEGTKGGRTRIVQIRTKEQLDVLEQAKTLSMQTRKGALVPPGKSPAQARARLYYVCGRLGITSSQLAITPHGLRHEYANDLYEDISGTPSVVRGSSQILDEAAEDLARHAVSEDLGHKRLSITAAYTGPSKRRPNIAAKQIRDSAASPTQTPKLKPNDEPPAVAQ